MADEVLASQAIARFSSLLRAASSGRFRIKVFKCTIAEFWALATHFSSAGELSWYMHPRFAALFVETGGVYFGLPDVDPWDEKRDARKYAGPWPVVAHPPCARWGRYWYGGPSAKVRKQIGDDNGCFASAISSVRQFGGVLEHPEASHAWVRFGLRAPEKSGGWYAAGDFQGWTCCVEQGHYGHRSRKATWLYAVNVALPSLKWGPSEAKIRLDDGFHSAEERRRAIKTGACQRLSKRESARTPEPFRDLLLSIARSCYVFG